MAEDALMTIIADSLTDLQSYIHESTSELEPLLPANIEETLSKDPLTNFQANLCTGPCIIFLEA